MALACPLFKHIFGYVGEKQFSFVACTSYRFRHVYLESFGIETFIRNALVSVSCSQLYLDMDRSGNNTRAIQLFQIATSEGQLGLLKWGQESGFEIHIMLGSNAMANAALNGHLKVV